MVSEHLNEIARELGFESYDKYLGSNLWRDKKNVFRSSNMSQQCIACGYPRIELHHVCYGRMGRELLTDLVPLCDNCHEMVHHCDRDGERVDFVLQFLFKWTGQERGIRFEKYTTMWNTDKGKPVRYWDFNIPFDKSIQTFDYNKSVAETAKAASNRYMSKNSEYNKLKKELNKHKKELKSYRRKEYEQNIAKKLAKGVY